MNESLIIATAGHTDHGKTQLIQAITGVNTDRLPEEQKRGITIDLGYAYKTFQNGNTIGFIDVPGHRQFIKNMLAGLAGIDTALLVVAANDGLMPQTLEHISILNLLGFKKCLVAITKIDLVDKNQTPTITKKIKTLLSNTSMSDADLFQLSSKSGEGLEKLVEALSTLTEKQDKKELWGNFRIPIDRVFSKKGEGLIVTGTVFSGIIKTGENLYIYPKQKKVKIRQIHSQNKSSNIGLAGQRCAINITGKNANISEVRRGNWLVEQKIAFETDRIDAHIRVLDQKQFNFKKQISVHLYLGTSHSLGRAYMIDNNKNPDNEHQYIRLKLQKPIFCVSGDPFILQDKSASYIVGGGKVVDPLAQDFKSKDAHITYLKTLRLENHLDALLNLLKISKNGLSLCKFRSIRNLKKEEANLLLGKIQARSEKIIIFQDKIEETIFTQKNWNLFLELMLQKIEIRHQQSPLEIGISKSTLKRVFQNELSDGVIEKAIKILISQGRLTGKNSLYHLPSHKIKLSKQEKKLWINVKNLLEMPGTVPSIGAIAKDLKIEIKELQILLKKINKGGSLIAITERRFITQRSFAHYVSVIKELSEKSPDGQFNAIMFKDKAKVGRNFTIELLEFLDRNKITLRIGDYRELIVSKNVLKLMTDGVP